MFIRLLFDESTRQFYLFWIITIIISIVLHELAHGWMAIRQGDDTPHHTGHMTGNPLVHMGPFSLAALFLAGIAWGSMPVDPTRMRGRYAEAKVAFAGPGVNILLALVAMTALGVWTRVDYRERFDRFEEPAAVQVEGYATPADERREEIASNAKLFLRVFGMANLALALFNLLPVPPLDGSAILANFHRGYATFIREKVHPGLLMLLFGIAFMLGRYFFQVAAAVQERYVDFIRMM